MWIGDPMFELERYADKDRLLQLISERASDEVLVAIAENDYGRDVEQHLEVLKQIRAGMYSFDPRQYYWFPLEVLELTRWTEPGDPAYRMPIDEIGQHIARAFSCAVMLRVAGDYPSLNYAGDGNDTLVQLVVSAEQLGHDVELATFMFLAWRISALDKHDECAAYFIVAAMYLYLKVSRSPSMELLEGLAQRAIEEEAALRVRCRRGDHKPGWLLPLTLFDQRHPAWVDLFKRLELMIEGLSPYNTSSLYELQTCVGA
jgi:hypothetical protein